jgi:hypothetical protein
MNKPLWYETLILWGWMWVAGILAVGFVFMSGVVFGWPGPGNRLGILCLFIPAFILCFIGVGAGVSAWENRREQ